MTTPFPCGNSNHSLMALQQLHDTYIMSMDESHNEKYFEDMLAKIRHELTPKIPALHPQLQQVLQSSLSTVVAAEETFDACQQAQKQATTEEEKKATAAALAAAEEALTRAKDTALQASTPILMALKDTLLQTDALDALLVKCSTLTNATKQLTEYSQQGDEQSKRIDELLSNTTLLRDMLYNGGAKGGNYGQAVEFYNEMCSSIPNNDENGILQRLALGTSLEFAVPMNEFDTNIPVHPVARFQHYQEALLHKELDPTFESQSTWACRYITNCDAPNTQLTWGRRMLRNYRPDMIELQDYKWRYCFLVRTDVLYCQPHWTSNPHSYPQILSGGGECGPRAWFGRFVLRAFGIPTWGVRQPGHAALGHWTPNEGWVICLGAAWKFSSWKGREGLDFVLEAQAREQVDEYMGVCRLEWVADALGEEEINGKSNPESMWRSLALLQKQHLASCTLSGVSENADDESTKSDVCSTFSQMDLLSARNTEFIVFRNDDTIIIPAVACTKPDKASKNAIFMKSFLGGMQLHIREDQSMEFDLTLKESGRYQLSIRLVTVHLKTQPLLLTISNVNGECMDDDIVAVSSIAIPYTVGDWAVTDPVEIDLAQGANVLVFARETPNYGLTIKELILTPCR